MMPWWEIAAWVTLFVGVPVTFTISVFKTNRPRGMNQREQRR